MESGKVVIQPPPQYQKSPRSRASLIVAVVIAIVSSVTLVTVCVGGGLYVSHLKSPNDAQEKVHFDNSINVTVVYQSEMIPETVWVNRASDEVLIEQKDEEGNLELLVARNYDTRVQGVYHLGRGECYLSHVSDDYSSVKDAINREFESVQGQNMVHFNDTAEIQAFKKDGMPVTDLSILPDSLEKHCQDKPTYWLKRAENDQGLRKKRAITITICWCGITIHIQ